MVHPRSHPSYFELRFSKVREYTNPFVNPSFPQASLFVLDSKFMLWLIADNSLSSEELVNV